MFNDLSTPLSLLTTRRSGKARDLVAPGPNAAQLEMILRIAARVPDHGKLTPWRFVTVGSDQRDAFAALLLKAYLADKPEAGQIECEAVKAFARQAPTLVVVLSSPNPDSHIPLWEQELSTGAACMNLLNATHAHGFVGAWLTGWATYSDMVRDAFGGAKDRIAGFIFLGTPIRPLEERPRPFLEAVTCRWTGPSRA